MVYWVNQYIKRQEIIDRCQKVGEWLVDHPTDSIRKVAKEFCMSKSQLHRDIHALYDIDNALYERCMSILRRHKRDGRVYHSRGYR